MTINLHQHHRVNWLDCSRRRLHQKSVASETKGANEATFTTEVASEDEHGIRWSEAPRRRGLQPSGHHSYPTPDTITADIGRSLAGHTTSDKLSPSLILSSVYIDNRLQHICILYLHDLYSPLYDFSRLTMHSVHKRGTLQDCPFERAVVFGIGTDKKHWVHARSSSHCRSSRQLVHTWSGPWMTAGRETADNCISPTHHLGRCQKHDLEKLAFLLVPDVCIDSCCTSAIMAAQFVYVILAW